MIELTEVMLHRLLVVCVFLILGLLIAWLSQLRQGWRKQQELERLRIVFERQQELLHESETQTELANQQVATLQNQQQELRQERQQLQREQIVEQERYAVLAQEQARLQTLLEQKQEHFEQQQRLLRESRDQLKMEFEQLAGQIFESREQVFNQQSRRSLDALLQPFREQIEVFQRKVEDIHHKDTRQQAALTQELLHLKEMNQQMSREAHDLATALKGQKKTQGSWGELILENLLERCGLQEGRDYRREVALRTEDGKGLLRPDVVVNLPEGRHLIIDAKVSLNAYTRFVNADTEEERQQALKEHIKALANHINELSARAYHRLPDLKSPEIVFLFVPVEAAFMEAFRADESLLQKAVDKNILVAAPTTLLTSLNIVRQLWRFEEQSSNTSELIQRAGKLYEKLHNFLESMTTVGNSLGRAQDAYDKACNQLARGPGNLVRQVDEFRRLGVSVRTELSAQWLDKSETEADSFSVSLNDSDDSNAEI